MLSRSDLTRNITPRGQSICAFPIRSDPNITPRGQPICAFPIRSDTQYNPQRTTYLCFPDQIWPPIYPPEDNLSGLSRSDLTPNITPRGQPIWAFPIRSDPQYTPRGQPIWAFPIRSDPQYTPQRTTYLGFPDQIWPPIYPPEDNLSGLSRSDLIPNITPRGQPIWAFPIRSDTRNITPRGQPIWAFPIRSDPQYNPQRTTYLGFPDQIWPPI